VGIEHRHKVQKLRLLKLKRTRITEDSESSARWASSECISAQEENRTIECSVEGRDSARRASRKCASRHNRRKNSLSSGS
jgi:hypothetical protein